MHGGVCPRDCSCAQGVRVHLYGHMPVHMHVHVHVHVRVHMHGVHLDVGADHGDLHHKVDDVVEPQRVLPSDDLYAHTIHSAYSRRVDLQAHGRPSSAPRVRSVATVDGPAACARSRPVTTPIRAARHCSTRPITCSLMRYKAELTPRPLTVGLAGPCWVGQQVHPTPSTRSQMVSPLCWCNSQAMGTV